MRKMIKKVLKKTGKEFVRVMSTYGTYMSNTYCYPY